MHWQLPVARWSATLFDAAPGREYPGLESLGVADAAPDVKFVDAMLRRRLGRLAKMALAAAHACAEDRPALRVVYASRHGELARSLAMLRDLAAGEPLSPTAFGLSVHNAAAGLLSILRRDTSPATAIAAGEETFGMALAEASAQFLADPESPVLLVYADEPVPVEYAGFIVRNDPPHAIALLFAHDGARRLSWSLEERRDPVSGEAQSLAFARGFDSGTRVEWTGARHTWVWH